MKNYKGFEVYGVGERIPQFANGKEATSFAITEGGLHLTVLVNRPTKVEISEFSSKKECEFRLCEIKGVLFLVSKFGKLPWMDSPYNPKFDGKPNILEEITENNGYLLTVMLVDSSNGEIKTMRALSLSYNFSKELREKSEYIENIYPNEKNSNYAYDENLSHTYNNYSTEDLVRFSSVRYKIKK